MAIRNVQEYTAGKDKRVFTIDWNLFAFFGHLREHVAVYV